MDIKKALKRLQNNNLMRSRSVRTSKIGRYVSVNGKQLLNFNSNDYLGLSAHPEIITAATQAIQKFGYGSTGSPMISGYTSIHQELEYALAQYMGFKRAVVFSSGFLANLGIAKALTSRNDIVIQDKLNHASLIDAVQFSGAELKRYAHNDLGKANQLLKKNSDKNTILCSDGIFSMDGDMADLLNLSVLALKYDSQLWIDDAHGIGVYGENGKGLMEVHHMSPQNIDILSGTLGKAFASAGAFVLGEHDQIEWIIQKARTYIYNTALSIADTAAALKSLELSVSESWRREKLWELIHYYKQQLAAFDLPDYGSETAIQPFIVGSDKSAIELANSLQNKGIYVTAIRPPTVPKNSSRLRITLSSLVEKEDIDILIQCLLGNY